MLLALCFITLPFKTRTAAQPNKTKTKQAPRRSTKKNKFFLLRQALVCRKKLWPTNRRHISTCTQNGTRQPSKKAPPGAIAMARGLPPNSTNWRAPTGTRESAKKRALEHTKWHKGVHQKARTGANATAQRSTRQSTKWSTKNGTRQPTKGTNWSTQNGTKEHTKSTKWSTKHCTKKPTKTARTGAHT